MTEGTEGSRPDEREERAAEASAADASEATPSEPTPSEPTPQESVAQAGAPADPAEATEPPVAAPVDEPAAAASEPAGSEPAGSEPEPVGSEPVGSWADVVDETVEEPVAESATAADDSLDGEADDSAAGADDSSTADDSSAAGDREPAGATAGAGGPTFDEQARQFMGQVEGFLGNVFRDASKVVGKVSERVGEERTSRGTPPPSADPRDLIDSVEGWVGDFFRGTPASRAAAGFGRAAVGSAFRSQTRRDDVWANATTAEEGAARECRYCPFCQTLAAVRNTRPDLYEQIGDTAKTLVHLVRQAAEQSARRPRQ